MSSPIVYAGDLPSQTISNRLARGDLVQLGRGVYATETARAPERIVRSHWAEIVDRLFPEAVITDRSARTGGPVDRVLYLCHPSRPRDAALSGLVVRAREGVGPLSDDVPYAGGLHLASTARGLADNCRPSRARSGAARTLDASEIGDWVDHVCQTEGEERLLAIRADAARIAAQVGVSAEQLAVLHAAVGVAVATRAQEESPPPALRLRRSGHPVDQGRVTRFEHLAHALRQAAPQSHVEESVPGQPGRTRLLPFYDAYFSNFIEGTEFDVDEARDIVLHGATTDRPKDAHDVRGTYAVLADDAQMRRTGADADEFIDLLVARHRLIMGGRPEKRPGEFKTEDNRAGDTRFVAWEQVEGTLRAGFTLRDTLDTAWERAVYVAFVVAEVHPFDDGNGRVARAMMNAELAVADQSRIIVPTVFRLDYLDGLRGLSRRGDPSVFIKAMRYAHDFTHSIDFHDYDDAKARLTLANAFHEPDSPSRLLVLPRRPAWDQPEAVREPPG